MLNKTATGYEAYTDFRARRDERAYTILQHLQIYVETPALGQRSHYTPEVVRAVQIDVLVAQCAANATRTIFELPARKRKPETIAVIIAKEFEVLAQ